MSNISKWYGKPTKTGAVTARRGTGAVNARYKGTAKPKCQGLPSVARLFALLWLEIREMDREGIPYRVVGAPPYEEPFEQLLSTERCYAQHWVTTLKAAGVKK